MGRDSMMQRNTRGLIVRDVAHSPCSAMTGLCKKTNRDQLW